MKAILAVIIFILIYNKSKNIKKSAKKSKAKQLGKEGEDQVSRELNKLNKDDYVLLNDLTLLYNGTTHQIDHVVVSNYGVFIIETKNYSGCIRGKEKSRTWVKYLGRNRYFFLNPIIQNKGHVKTLESIYPEYKDFFVPIVCFMDKCKLNIETSSIVIKLEELLYTISKYRTDVLISDINEVANNLKNLSLGDMNGIKQHHIDNIHRKKGINNN